MLAMPAISGTDQSAPFALYPGQHSWHLAGQLQIGPVGDELTAAELLARPEIFHQHPGTPSWGFSDQTHWVRLTLQSHFSDQELWLLEVDPVFTDHLTLYWKDEQGHLQQLKAGDLLQASKRPLNLPQQVFPIEIKPGEQKEFLLRVAGTNPLFAEIQLWLPEAFIEKAQRSNFYMSAYLAVLALMTLLGLIYSFLLKNRIYSYYTLYVFAQLCFQVAHSGYLGWMLDLTWTRLPDLMTSGSIAISLGFFALLFSRITGMNKDYPQLALGYLVLAWLVATLGILFVLQDNYAVISPWIHLYILLLTGFAVLYSLFLILRGQYRQGSAYLLIFGVLAVGVILRILRDQAVLPNNFWTENAIYLGTLVHLLVMQFMIIWTINQSRQANARELENRVQLRTAELNASLHKESQSRQVQQDFLRMVSNEFRTPLSVIDGALTLLDMQQNTETSNRIAWLERIRGAQQRLVSLVDTSFWDQRLADDDWQPSRISIELLPWMIQLTENLRRMYNNKIIVLQTETGCQVKVDPEMLQMLLQSLVDTLVIHLPEEGEVVLSLGVEEEKVFIRVATPGKGLLPELADQMQNRYDSSPDRKSGGGLYLAGAAARKLGGELEYKFLQQGASFVVTLPRETKKKVA